MSVNIFKHIVSCKNPYSNNVINTNVDKDVQSIKNNKYDLHTKYNGNTPLIYNLKKRFS